MRVKVNASKHNSQSLEILQARIQKETAKQLMNMVEVGLTTATEHTPKWSGEATQSWRISLKGDVAATTNYTPTPMQAPVFEGGIHDPKAAAFNRSVVNKELRRIRLGVYSQVRAGKDVKITLYNTQPYAQKWLSDTTNLGFLLRVVNQDYFTYREIAKEIRVAIQMQSAGFW